MNSLEDPYRLFSTHGTSHPSPLICRGYHYSCLGIGTCCAGSEHNEEPVQEFLEPSREAPGVKTIIEPPLPIDPGTHARPIE